MLSTLDRLLSPKSSLDRIFSESYSKPKTEAVSTQYIKNQNTYTPVGPINLVPKLDSGIYKAMKGPYFLKVDPTSDSLLKFENSVMTEVTNEVKKFWELKENFTKLGLLHNRGILLEGPPGSGKTCLLHQVAEEMTKSDEVVLIGSDISSVKSLLHSFREVESSRKVVVMLEDMDEYIKYSEQSTLQLLDGGDSVDGVLFIGTTNYIERFPPRLIRPGRFDKIVTVGYPEAEGRLAYLQNKLTNVANEDDINSLVQRTEGFSFGHLRELVIAGYAFEENIDDVIERLKDVSYKMLVNNHKSGPDTVDVASECLGIKL